MNQEPTASILAIHPFSTNTFRIQVGAELNHALESQCYTIMPQAQAAWVKDIWLTKRYIAAHLQTIIGRFSVEGMKEEPGHFVGGVGLNVLCAIASHYSCVMM